MSNFMLCLMEPFLPPSSPPGLTQRWRSWRQSHKLLCDRAMPSVLLVGMASDAACCTPGLALGGIYLQVLLSAEMVGGQGIVCLSLSSDLQMFPSDAWVIHMILF